MALGFLTGSMRASNACLIFRFSTTTSTIQSTLGQLIEIIFQITDADQVRILGLHKKGRLGHEHRIEALFLAIRFRAAGSFFSASVRSGGTMSRSRVFTPELASSAAMPPPMTPLPMTAAFLIFSDHNTLLH